MKVLGYGLLLIIIAIGISGGIKSMQLASDRKIAEAAAIRAEFMDSCIADEGATESFCACVYDGLGEEAILEAYDYYEKYQAYNLPFKAQALECEGEL